jgi:hypothetical protein
MTHAVISLRGQLDIQRQALRHDRLRLSKELDRHITLDQQETLKKPFHTKVILWKSQKVKVKIKA